MLWKERVVDKTCSYLKQIKKRDNFFETDRKKRKQKKMEN